MARTFILKVLIASAALLGGGTAFAQGLALDSRIYVETKVKQADGTFRTELAPAKRATPGDSLVIVVEYRNSGSIPATNVLLTNPVPTAIAFRDTGDKDAELSIDGGRSWGQLSDFRITERDGTERQAVPEDVTHIRWRVAGAIPAGSSGKLSFRGVVR